MWNLKNKTKTKTELFDADNSEWLPEVGSKRWVK